MQSRRFRIIRQSFRNQMLFTFSLVTLLVGITLSLVSYGLFSRIVRREVLDSSRKLADVVGLKLEMVLDETDKLLAWAQSDDVYRFIVSDGDSPQLALRLIQDINQYQSSRLVSDRLENIYLLGNNGVCFNNHTGPFHIGEKEEGKRLFSLVSSSSQRIFSYWDEERGKDFIVMASPILQPATEKVLGYEVLECSPDFLLDLYENERIGVSGGFLLVDGQGEPVLRVSKENKPLADILKTSSVEFSGESQQVKERIDGKKLLLLGNKVRFTPWYLVGIVPEGEMLRRDMQVVTATLALAAALIFLGGFFLYSYMTRRMVRPIQELKKQMLLAGKGNLDATVTCTSNDEFAILETQYNSMLGQIKHLMEESSREQKMLQLAELNMLQAQISPHFLYNTLEAAIWMIAVNDNENAIAMLDHLSVFFKTGLNNGEDFLPVEDEITHVSSYLYIQQKRFKDNLTFDIDIASTLKGERMLKMLLQPVVENALEHGIRQKGMSGHISVSGIAQGDDMIFSVRDDGGGIPPQKLASLQASLGERPCDAHMGYGLYNVNRRIRLYYGSGYGLTVTSREEEGTEVVVRIGKKTARGGNVQDFVG
jgi:two-component system sensor histidine kinase YesM